METIKDNTSFYEINGIKEGNHCKYLKYINGRFGLHKIRPDWGVSISWNCDDNLKKNITSYEGPVYSINCAYEGSDSIKYPTYINRRMQGHYFAQYNDGTISIPYFNNGLQTNIYIYDHKYQVNGIYDGEHIEYDRNCNEPMYSQHNINGNSNGIFIIGNSKINKKNGNSNSEFL